MGKASELADSLRDYAETHGIHMYRVAVDVGVDSQLRELVPANLCNNIYSVAKTYTMTAIGMLYDEGLLTPSSKITDIFSDEVRQYAAEYEIDAKWYDVTVDDVLLHRMGISSGFLDIDNDDINTFGTTDFLKIIFTHKLDHKAGDVYVYSDAAYYLASRVVSKLSGRRLDEFLMDRLFVPLGFKEMAWSQCPHNYTIGATGLYIRVCDMVKLARLYLNRGMWNGQRLISEEWIDIALKRGYEFVVCDDKGGYAKGGMNGQFLYFSYKDDMAAAWQCYDPNGKSHELRALL